MTKTSNPDQWNPVYDRFLALPINDQHKVGMIYQKLQIDHPNTYNHIHMHAALVEFGISSGRMQMMDGALEYEEAMAGAELIAGEG